MFNKITVQLKHASKQKAENKTAYVNANQVCYSFSYRMF